MDIKKIRKIIKENEIELENINNKTDEYKDFSENAINERKIFLEQQNNSLKKFAKVYDTCISEIKTLEKSKGNDKKANKIINKNINSIYSKIEEVAKEVKGLSRGRIRDIISAYFGQIDKKVHNALYGKNTSFRNGLWRAYSSMVNKRYKNVPGYVLKNLGIGVLFVMAAGMSTVILPVSTTIMPTVGAIFGIFMANTVIKAASAAYNNLRYGGPFLKRKYDIQNGTYNENIANSLLKYRKSKLELSNSIEYTGKSSSSTAPIATTPVESKDEEKTEEKKLAKNKENIERVNDAIRNIDLNTAIKEQLASIIAGVNGIGRENVAEDLREKYSKLVAYYNYLYRTVDKKAEPVLKPETEERKVNKTESKVTKPNINDYGNIRMGLPGMEQGVKMSLNEAIRIVRDSKIPIEEKHNAMAKIIMTFGNGDAKENKTSSSKLSEFNRNEKEMAEIGRRIRSGKSTQADVNRLAELIYHFSGVDTHMGELYDEDYASNEYDRYVEDQKKYYESEEEKRGKSR